jgi:hypothetical protein
MAATRVFLAATGKTLGPGLEAQATAFMRRQSKRSMLGLPKTDSQKRADIKTDTKGVKKGMVGLLRCTGTLRRNAVPLRAGRQRVRVIECPAG